MAITRVTRRSPFLSPWHELESVSKRLDGLFNSPLRDVPAGAGAWNPPVNVEETEEEMVLSAELPGMGIEDIEIEVENKLLTLRGEKKEIKEEGDERRYHVWERTYGSFQRRFTLPRTVKTEGISAEFENGILSIRMPKAPEAKSRKIEIKA